MCTWTFFVNFTTSITSYGIVGFLLCSIKRFFANENRKSRQTKPKSEFALTWSEREKGDAGREDRRLGGGLSTALEDERTRTRRKEKNEKRRTY
ncbi:unnamed protein product [Lactuca virosa]|uniref:Transmembrane protein n=1 Tax=Lactuca virosa TaxID=75947 RepID=A0AAU9LXQ7_9ASTR|nr:unnamed protein product [Lactuca virosa]